MHYIDGVYRAYVKSKVTGAGGEAFDPPSQRMQAGPLAARGRRANGAHSFSSDLSLAPPLSTLMFSCAARSTISLRLRAETLCAISAAYLQGGEGRWRWMARWVEGRSAAWRMRRWQGGRAGLSEASRRGGEWER